MHEHIIHSADECVPANGYCRTHELNILLLAALYAVSRVLSRSLAFNETLRDVLRVLHDEAGLSRGLSDGLLVGTHRTLSNDFVFQKLIAEMPATMKKIRIAIVLARA